MVCWTKIPPKRIGYDTINKTGELKSVNVPCEICRAHCRNYANTIPHREIEMKRDIRRALQFIHKRAVNSGGEGLYPQGICFNMQMLIGDADYARFKGDCEEIYKGYKDYSGIYGYPIKSGVAGESPVECYLSQCSTDSRWKGEQLQKRIELLEVMIQSYAPKKRVKKDV